MTDQDNDEAASRSVLGAILLSGGRVLDWLDLHPADHKQPVHEQIHRTCQQLKDTGKPVDPVTVADLMRKQGLRMDPSLPHTLMSETSSEAAAEYHSRIVATSASRRRIRAATVTMQALVDQQAEPEMILEEAHAELSRIKPSGHADPVRFLGETLGATIDELEEKPDYKPTPWPQLNDRIGGLRPGALYVIGARPGVGKSVVGLQLATALADHGSVAFISLEMRSSDLHKRAMSTHAKVDMRKLENHQLDESDWTKISRVADKLADMPIAVLDRPSATIGEIKRYITATHRRKPLAGVVLDYLQLMDPPPGDRRPRHEYVAAMSRQLKVLAMELNVPIIAISQLNRGSTGREDKRPQLSDLRESGAIEQDADVVILLHREFEEGKAHEITLGVAKNRRGQPGSMTLDFYGHYSEVRDPITR